MFDIVDELKGNIRHLWNQQELMSRRIESLVNGHCVNLGGYRMLTETRSGLRMLIDGRDTGSGLEILHSGYIEPDVMKVLQRTFTPGAVFLDVGANFGFYTLFAAQQMGQAGQVYSFEANPHLIPFIEGSVYINGLRDRVTLINKAVADAPGTARFGFSYAHIGGGSLLLGGNDAVSNEYVEVPLVRIDDVLPADVVVDVVKLDVEGHEAAALRGMKGVVARSPNIQLVLEFFPGMQAGSGGGEILDLLSEMGLQYWKIGHRGRLHDVHRDDLINGEDCYLVAARSKPEDEGLELPTSALRLVGTADAGGMLTTGANDVLVHGPYWYLSQGSYEVTVHGDLRGSVRAAVTHEFGFELASARLSEGAATFRFSTNSDLRYFEVVLRAIDGNSGVRIDKVTIKDLG